MQQSKLRAAIQAGIGTCMWGVGGVCSNIIFNNTAATPQWLSGMRMFWSGLVMLLLALATKKDIWAIWRDRRAAVRLIAFGLFGVAAPSSPTCWPSSTGTPPWPPSYLRSSPP